jgi:SAM-dependent methyltransferase
MTMRAGQTLLDCGAGVGGPAAWAAAEHGVRPVLAEPEGGACRASRRLFARPVLQASGDALPLRTDAVDAAWALGVLCTMRDQLGLLCELARVVRAPGRIGLLVFVAQADRLDECPEGNDFPTSARLDELLGQAHLRIDARTRLDDLPDEPGHWRERQRAIADELDRRHGAHPACRVAAEQSAIIGRLIGSGQLAGELLSLRSI